jgi:CheY-like chemotaxis protein
MVSATIPGIPVLENSPRDELGERLMFAYPEPPKTSVLLIDGSQTERSYWADQLKRCSEDYEIFEAADGQAGLEIYRSRRIDCVVLELSLPHQAGFKTLMELVPRARRPHISVVVLTVMTHPGVSDLAKHNGAYACLLKKLTTGEDLDKAIRRAMAFVGQMPKEDRYRPI